MQKDKHLQELLKKGGIENAQPDFTGTVMKRIERIKYIHEPLVSKKWIRVYRITFLMVLGLMVLTGFVLKFSAISFAQSIKLPELYLKYANTILIYIIGFWILVWVIQKLEHRQKAVNAS